MDSCMRAKGLLVTSFQKSCERAELWFLAQDVDVDVEREWMEVNNDHSRDNVWKQAPSE